MVNEGAMADNRGEVKTMPERTAHRYEAANRNTETMLADALKRLMKTKPFAKISVRELTEECGVNRKTFYYHFENMEALLRWSMEHDAFNAFPGIEACTDPEELVGFVIQYADEHRRLLFTAFDAMGGELMRQRLFNAFHRVIRLQIEKLEAARGRAFPEEQREFVLDFYSEAFGSNLLRYLRRKLPYTQQQMTDYTIRLLRTALPAALE